MINNRQDQIQKEYFTVAPYERELVTEVSGDFVLPDYQCDIRRILCVFATVLPPAKYVSASEAEFSGTVDFRVTYVGGDGELYSIPLSEAYSFSVPLDAEGEAGESTVLCSIRADGVNTRVSAPRKLNLRLRLRPYVRVLRQTPATLAIIGDAPADSVFRRIERARRLECESSVSEIVPVESVMPPLADDVRIVSADAGAVVTACSYIPGGVRCQGKVRIKLVCVSDGGEFSTRTKEVPFESENEISLRDASLRATATVCDMTVNVGDEGVECSMGVVSEVVACANTEQEYTADAYSDSNECECISASLMARSYTMCACGNATLSERIAIADTSVPADAEIIDAFARASMQTCEWQNGKYVFGGNADITLIWRKDADFGVQELHVPIRYEHSCGDGGEIACFDASVALDGLRCRIEGDNLCVDAELVVSADCMAEHTVNMIETLELGEQYISARKAGLTVCYPDSQDTLWAIAKRYKVSPAAVSGEVGSDRFVFVD